MADGARRRVSPGLRICLVAVKALPRHAMSRLVGWLASRELPNLLQRWQIRLFARCVGADLGEALEPLSSYSSLQSFFVRHLRGDARPIDRNPTAVVAPCDGFWGQSGTVDEGRLLQIKGSSYSLGDLLGDPRKARSFEGGPYSTFYLSPRDYHRLHAPCDLSITSVTYLPGDLWPVNRIGLEGIEGLFVANERVVVSATFPGTSAEVCLVAVGATIVGKIRLSFDELEMTGKRIRRSYEPGEVICRKGEEWGRFELGSTVVMIARADSFDLEAKSNGEILRLGSRIGSWCEWPIDRGHRTES